LAKWSKARTPDLWEGALPVLLVNTAMDLRFDYKKGPQYLDNKEQRKIFSSLLQRSPAL
jgi:hypothetical protein